MAARKKTHTKLVVRDDRMDLWWKWIGRTCLVLVPIFGGLWWIFGWYSGVESVKAKVGELSHRVEAMWEGQTKILDELKRVNVPAHEGRR